MKKIVSVMTIAAMATAMFAADPTFAPAVTEYTGEAAISYKVELDGVNAGIVNEESASLKFSLWSDGSKATTGEGLWGELVIKSDGSGDNNFVGPVTPAVDTAKIHFVDDDFYANVNIKAPAFSVGGGDESSAVKSPVVGLPSAKVDLANAAGFTVNLGLKDVVDANIAFADNGVVKFDAKKFAVKAEASLKAVENLDAYAGVAWSQEEADVAVAAKAGYKVALGETLSLKPAVGFAMKGAAKELGANVLLAWGAVDQEPNFHGYSNSVASVENKTANGVSASVKTGDFKNFDIVAGVYDATLVEGLKAGVQFVSASKTIDVAAAYSTALDIWNLGCYAGSKIVLGNSTNLGFVYGASVNTDGIIQNTNLSVGYDGEHAADIGGVDTNGTIVLKAKIHF